MARWPLDAGWAQRFPELFDEQDVRTAENQPQYHFVEWLAAIVLHHATGFLALVEKYAYANHPRKQEIVAKLLPDDVLRVLRDRTEHGSIQGPDLLMYAQTCQTGSSARSRVRGTAYVQSR